MKDFLVIRCDEVLVCSDLEKWTEEKLCGLWWTGQDREKDTGYGGKYGFIGWFEGTHFIAASSSATTIVVIVVVANSKYSASTDNDTNNTHIRRYCHYKCVLSRLQLNIKSGVHHILIYVRHPNQFQMCSLRSYYCPAWSNERRRQKKRRISARRRRWRNNWTTETGIPVVLSWHRSDALYFSKPHRFVGGHGIYEELVVWSSVGV